MARIAFYAPLKPPDHPVPSGDRRIARLFIDALGMAGHDVRVASAFRSYEGDGSAQRQATIAEEGAAEARRLTDRYRAGDWRPDLWFTYHLYHKAPDHLGPAIASTLDIPYVVAEASYAPKRAGGPWDPGHRAVAAALARADHVVFLNPIDRGCVLPILTDRTAITDLLPFLDTAPFRQAAADRSSARRNLVAEYDLNERSAILLAVAMMRRGDKLSSYRLLADALRTVPQEGWSLVLVGNGPARAEVETAFAGFGDKVRLLGDRADGDLPRLYAGADIFVWPGIGEAIGMAVLEAQCTGTPAVVGDGGSLGLLVENGHSGRVEPVGDAAAFGRAVAALIGDPSERSKLAAGARSRSSLHDIAAASTVLERIIEKLLNNDA